MKKLIVVLISVVSLSAAAQDNPKYLNVMAVNGLNMRSQPDAKSRVVTKVAYGNKVEIMEKSKVQLQLGWVSDHWYKVAYRGREGFIFGGYLSGYAAPKLQKTQKLSDLLPLYCTKTYTMAGNPVLTTEVIGHDTLKLQLVKFKNGAELELENSRDRSQATLIIPGSVQDAYVFLEALLKSNESEELLDELRFIRGKDGLLSRVNNANETISIKSFDDGLTVIKLTDFFTTN